MENEISRQIRERLESDPAIQQILRAMHQDKMDRELEGARKDPKKHRLTTVFDKGTSYRYQPGGKDEAGNTVRFCWSCWKNVAGYYLSWREVWRPDGTGFRDGWAAHKQKKQARAWSERWRDEMENAGEAEHR